MIVDICILTTIAALSAILRLIIPLFGQVGLSPGSGVQLKPERLYRLYPKRR
jgi:hypothetical protein